MKNFLLALLCLSFPFLAIGRDASTSPATFSKVGEIVERWSDHQKLWISGNLPLSNQNLSRLEQWLDKEAPNWTVVLMQHASGQQFNGHYGMDAVEFALGQQISNKTNFGERMDSRTQQKNGAIFVLFLEERKFSYFSSEAMDSRRLGHHQWVGNLDGKAVYAMRNGGRIFDAVTHTISDIEGRLSRSIEQEIAAAKRAELERRRAIEEAKQMPEVIGNEIAAVVKVLRNFRAKNPAVRGDLVNPDIDAWRADVRAINLFAEGEEPKKVAALVEKTRREMAQFRTSLERWEADKGELTRLQSRIDQVPDAPEVPVVNGYLAGAREALQSAQSNHAIGDVLYRKQIKTGDELVSRAMSEFKAWEAAVAAEKRRLEVREKIIRFSSIAAVVLLLVFLIALNRLRVPARTEAEQALKTWRKKLRGKFDRLFGLMDRATELIGPLSGLDHRGYIGTTESLCKESAHEVDELFIMSSSIDQVMDRVTNLIEPKGFGGILANLFLSNRYQKATQLLSTQPVTFDPDTELEQILAPSDRKLLGEASDYKPFQMSFARLIDRYDEKQENAGKMIERLGQGIDGLPLQLEALQGRQSLASSQQEELQSEAVEDGFFPMRAFADDLLPRVQRNIEDAAEVGRKDPVAAFETSIASATRQLANAERLLACGEKARGETFPLVQKLVAKLEGLDRRTDWIDKAYSEQTSTAEQLLALAVDRSVETEIASLEQDLFSLIGRIRSCAELANRAETSVAKSIATSRERTDQVRRDLASSLGQASELIFKEEQLSPDRRIDSALAELDAARSALDHGNAMAAVEDFSDVEILLDEVADLLVLSQDIAENHAARHSEFKATLDQIRTRVPACDRLLRELIEDYDPAVLRFSSRFGTSARGLDSIRDSIIDTESSLKETDTALSNSIEAFQSAQLISAGSLLERAGNELGFAEHQLALIEDQHSALKEAEATNMAKFEQFQRDTVDTAARVLDRRTMMPTLLEFKKLESELSEIEAAFLEAKPNPFGISLAIEAAEKLRCAAESGVESDWDLYAEAETAVSAAESALKKSDRLIHQATTDGIPDSRALQKGMGHYEKLQDFLGRADEYLQKPHGDWADLFESASSAAADALTVRTVLDQQLRLAESAVEEIRRAAKAISELKRWRSSYSVRRDAGAGTGAFREANAFLENGEYESAIQLAVGSQHEAARELSDAKRRERDARDEERRRAAREAARRRRASSSSGFGISSSGGRSSGFSRSSSGSSSSGFSRSGW